MEDVGRQKAIDVDWRFFSLRKINEGRDLPERFRVSHLMGLRALRVAAAVREQHGPEAVRKLYTVMGTRKHQIRLISVRWRSWSRSSAPVACRRRSPLLPMTRRGIK